MDSYNNNFDTITETCSINSQDTLQNENNTVIFNPELEDEFDNDITEAPEVPLPASRVSFTNLLGELGVEVDKQKDMDHAVYIRPLEPITIDTEPEDHVAVEVVSNPVSEWKDESLNLLTKITIKESL